CRSHRHAARQVGRAGDRGGRAEGGLGRRRDRPRRVCRHAARGLQAAAALRVPRRAAAKRRQQGADERAPGAVQVSVTLGAFLDATVARHPAREAVAWAPRDTVTARLTWAELRAASRTAATKLGGAGVT